MRPYVIGIAGASCSGKTSIAESVKSRLEPRETVIVAIDSYYIDLSHLRPEERALHNFDSPASIDFDLLLEQLRLLIAGEKISMPVYRFDTHTRVPENEWIDRRLDMKEGKRAVIIIEGLHTFYRRDIRDLIDTLIFIDITMETSLSRRVERDVRERGRDEAGVRRQFEETVVPMFEKHVLPAKRFADIIIKGEEPVDESAALIIDMILPVIDKTPYT